MVSVLPFSATFLAALLSPKEKLDPINPDRPSSTTSPAIVAPGHIQLETGFLYTRKGTLKLQEFGDGTTIRIPTNKDFEFRVSVGNYAIAADSGVRLVGFEDSGLGFKVMLAHGSDKFSWRKPRVAINANVTFPSGANAFRENALQPQALLLAEWDFLSDTNLTLNGGLASRSQNGQRFTQFVWTSTMVHQFGARTSAYVEAFGIAPASPHGPGSNYLDMGASYLINNDTMADVRIGQGINGVSPDYFLGVGLSLRW